MQSTTRMQPMDTLAEDRSHILKQISLDTQLFLILPYLMLNKYLIRN
jgi:hypothetical protein